MTSLLRIIGMVLGIPLVVLIVLSIVRLGFLWTLLIVLYIYFISPMVSLLFSFFVRLRISFRKDIFSVIEIIEGSFEALVMLSFYFLLNYLFFIPEYFIYFLLGEYFVYELYQKAHSNEEYDGFYGFFMVVLI